MAVAAVPEYISQLFKGNDNFFPALPPGHRFGLFFPVWEPEKWSRVEGESKNDALKKTLKLGEEAKKLLTNLGERQQSLACSLESQMVRRVGKSRAPFMTGLGTEHPTENGFAFLQPYGLPYLPGSGVKGVLRTAAESLALGLDGTAEDWSLATLWWLFGFEAGSAYLTGEPGNIQDNILVDEARVLQEAYLRRIEDEGVDNDQALQEFIKVAVPQIKVAVPQKEREEFVSEPRTFLRSLAKEKKLRKAVSLAGALTFWDVFPKPASDALAIDILTPHFGDYYEKGATPADCGQPNPVVFLAIPPGSEFVFHCRCREEYLPTGLQDKWPKLLDQVFVQAFEWLGFGAKTAVGYGQMHRDESAEQAFQAKAQKAQKEAEKKAVLAGVPPEERAWKMELLELKNLLEREQQAGNDSSSAPLSSAFSTLHREADDWPSEYRKELAELGESIYKFVGWGKGKKKKEKKARLQALKGNPPA